MSKSFAIVNGDLAIGSGRALQIVSGKNKLMQDLELWILEKIGTDPSTPTYGSTLDGGVENGQPVLSFIGQIISDTTISEIRSEIITLLQQYQSMQFTKMAAEALAYNGKNTLDEDEVLESINSVNVTNVGATIIAQASITTLAGSTIQITLPVQG